MENKCCLIRNLLVWIEFCDFTFDQINIWIGLPRTICSATLGSVVVTVPCDWKFPMLITRFWRDLDVEPDLFV